jgi:hypothetical protein
MTVVAISAVLALGLMVITLGSSRAGQEPNPPGASRCAYCSGCAAGCALRGSRLEAAVSLTRSQPAVLPTPDFSRGLAARSFVQAAARWIRFDYSDPTRASVHARSPAILVRPTQRGLERSLASFDTGKEELPRL